MTSRGLSTLDSQQRSLPQHSNLASFGGSEVPMNFNYLGGQQQMSGQQPGMLQSLPLQQSGINDAHLMQQQVMYKHMQELRRRQQLHQLETMQRNAMNHISTFPNQLAGQQSQPINGNPVLDTCNYPWQSQVTGGGTNWQQRGYPSAVHAYSNGLVVSPEQGQAMRFMGLIPQEASQSLYGVPVSDAGGGNLLSQNSIDKPEVCHLPAPSSSFSGNPYAPHAEQVSSQDARPASRSGFEGKTSFEHASSQGAENAVNLGNFNQVQQMKVSMSDSGGPGFLCGSDISLGKSLMQAAASQPTSSQSAVGLDPTEEKILFGDDDSIWEAFGGASVTGNDGADLFNGFPSMQSGTWSALMQSAVAETSNSDVGMQEEWSGLEAQNSRLQSGNQPLPTSQDNGEPPPVWVDSSQRGSLGMRTTSNDASANNTILKTKFSHSFRLQQECSNQRSSPTENQVLQEGRRWLESNSPKASSEEKRLLENLNSSRNLSKIDSGFWGHQQSTFLAESVPDSNLNSSQGPPDNHSLDLCKPVKFDTKSGIVGSGFDHLNMKKGQSVLDCLVNTPGGGVAEIHATENGDGRENSNDNHQNMFANHSLSGSSRENVWSDSSDRHFLPGPQEISSGYASGKVPVARKFQYHPMGDVDVDESSSEKQVSHTQSMSPSSGLKLHEAQQTLLGPAGSSSSNMEKGRVSGFNGGLCSNAHPGYVPSTPAAFARSGGNSSANQHLSPSQNMLELLHKVDQSKDQNAVSNLSSINYNRAFDIPAGGCIGPGQSQPSTSHGFNLQLAPPSQGIALSNLNDPVQSSLRSVGSPSSMLVPSEKADNMHAWLASGPSTQCLPPSHRPPQLDSGNDKSGGLDDSQSTLKGSLSASLASNPLNLGNPFQNQQKTAAGGQMMSNLQSFIVSSDGHAYHDQQSTNFQNQVVANQAISNLHNLASERDPNQSVMRASMHRMLPSMHAVMAEMRKDDMSLGGPHLWTSQPPMMGAQARNDSDLLKSHFQSNDAPGMHSISQLKKDELDGPRSTVAVSFQGVAGGQELTIADPRSSVGVSQDESLGRQSMEASPSSSVASQKDADVFHHSLKPNDTAHHSYSLLQQMQALKTMDMDPSHRKSKRVRGPESCPDSSQMAEKAPEPSSDGMNIMVRDPSVSQTSVSSGDAKMLSFTPQSGNRNIYSQSHGAVASHDMLPFGHSDPPKYGTGSITNRVQLTDISPQMASTWFEQYGAFRNGQLLPLHNMPRVPMVQNVEQQFGDPPSNFVVQNSIQLENVVSDTCQTALTSQTTNAYSVSEHASSLNVLVPHFSSPNPMSMRLKKRKTATSDLIPWNKEIEQGFMRIQDISSSEVYWAQSSNRLAERGGDETDSHEDMPLIVRPRRRLILTTKLMQQVFCPPSASILSLDARSYYEVIMYSIARLALGNACNLVCGLESDSLPDDGNSKAKSSERIGDQYLSKVMEDFTNRAKELEDDLLRLDKRASILDFRLDCQDLERFSVINRFARYHSRSQVDGVNSSSSDPNAISLKPCPQRYVTAHPMPRTLPERVQCLTIN